MNVVIAGSTGLLGAALRAALVGAGHQVTVLTRRPGARGASDDGSRIVGWVPDGTVGAWSSALDGADAVVNLAGESIAADRWTPARKARILDSRVRATRSLVAAMRQVAASPPVLVSASAQGYYGDRGDDPLPEESAAGHDFLADVCVRWEAEARAAEDVARVVRLRTGIVLAAGGGALPRMTLPFRLFAGGPLGSGRQFMSWIHLEDWVAMARWALANVRVAGPLNVAVPVAVRNADFARAVGRALGRPSWASAPALALRVAVGEMAGPLLLSSIRLVPSRALALGYPFRFTDLDGALRNLL
jgi:hypothetical protein